MKLHPIPLIAAVSLMTSIISRADIDIYIAGAVSLKDITYNSLLSLYGGAPSSVNLDNASKPTSANVYTMTGTMPTLFGSQTVNVYVNWNGSGSAIKSLTGNGPCSFYGSSTQGVTNLVNANVDVGFSVVFQKDYSYPTPVLTDTMYGATPTIFAKSVDAPAALTNLTSQQLRFIEANGSAPASIFTGDATDTNEIYWIMRDIGAAHRVISAKEAGFSGSALAYNYTNGTWVLDSVGQTKWSLIDKMLTSHYGACISFLPPTEAGNLPSTNILSFNGFRPFQGSFSTVTNDYTPVITGLYTCWGFEHIMTKPTANANITAFANALRSTIEANMSTSPYSVPLSKMQVTRSSTGGLISPK